MRYLAFCGLTVVLTGCSQAKSTTTSDQIPAVRLTQQIFSTDAIDSATWAIRMPNGNVAIADRAASNIAFFSPTGVQLRRSGGRGSHPGQFMLPTWIGRCSSTVMYVVDAMTARLNVLDTAGVFKRSAPLPIISAAAPGCSGNNIVFAASEPGAPDIERPNEPARVHTGVLHYVDDTGDDVASVDDVQLWKGYAPLSPRSSIAGSRNWVYFGTGESGTVLKYDAKGQRSGMLNLKLPVRQTTDRDVTGWIEETVSVFNDEYTRQTNRTFLRRYTPSATVPAFRQLFADPSGNVWALTSAFGDSITTLRGAAPDGKLIADVTIPKYLKVFEVGSDYVIGRYRDNGRTHVVAYRLSIPR